MNMFVPLQAIRARVEPYCLQLQVRHLAQAPQGGKWATIDCHTGTLPGAESPYDYHDACLSTGTCNAQWHIRNNTVLHTLTLSYIGGKALTRIQRRLRGSHSEPR